MSTGTSGEPRPGYSKVAGAGRSAVAALLLVTAVTFSLGMLQKASCYESGWRDTTVTYTHMCYTDLPYLYVWRGFAEGQWPFGPEESSQKYRPMEYPPIISYWAFGSAILTHSLTGGPAPGLTELTPDAIWALPSSAHETKVFASINALILVACALVTTTCLAMVRRKDPWTVLGFAASPLLLTTALINWDLIAVALVSGAVLAWERGRWNLCGVLIGLGFAAKMYPLLLLGAAIVLAIRQRELRTPAAKVGAWAAVAAMAVTVPSLLHGGEKWAYFWTFNSDRGADIGSLWLVINDIGNFETPVSVINLVSWAFLVAWCTGVLVLGVRPPSPPSFAQLGFLIVLGFVVINKVYSPQYALWLLPLAVLARPQWKDQALWQGTELIYFCTVWWFLASPYEGPIVFVYWSIVVLRIVGQLNLGSRVVQDIVRAPAEHHSVKYAVRQ